MEVNGSVTIGGDVTMEGDISGLGAVQVIDGGILRFDGDTTSDATIETETGAALATVGNSDVIIFKDPTTLRADLSGGGTFVLAVAPERAGEVWAIDSQGLGGATLEVAFGSEATMVSNPDGAVVEVDGALSLDGGAATDGGAVSMGSLFVSAPGVLDISVPAGAGNLPLVINAIRSAQ